MQTGNRNSNIRPLALVAGASTGIGYELAKCCAEKRFDLLIANESEIETADKAGDVNHWPTSPHFLSLAYRPI
jgi:NAD(P)-dependent dehydrogenase (short-subunit alcohol dehydrogenase family)